MYITPKGNGNRLNQYYQSIYTQKVTILNNKSIFVPFLNNIFDLNL